MRAGILRPPLNRVPMPSRPEFSEEQEHPPALSGTRSAWAALSLLAVLIGAWLFLNPLACTLLKSGFIAASWLRGEQLHVGKLTLEENGSFLAQEVEWNYGPKNHRSSWKSDWLVLRPTPLWDLIRPEKNQLPSVIREIAAGTTKLLLDHRDTPTSAKNPHGAEATEFTKKHFNIFPSSCTAGPVDVVVIGESYRAAVSGLYFTLPERWAGEMSFREGTIDVGSWHRTIPKGRVAALLEGNTLRLGALNLGSELGLKELTLTQSGEGLEFGIQGTVGKGLLRGDGVIGAGGNRDNLEVTLVGERLALDAFSPLMSRKNQASGIISQARFTFRGDTAHPLEAASSLRLVAENFQWEGRGWESLHLAATLTGRNLTVSEFSLQQHENELTAEGQSRLPEDWRAALLAPFTARFRAQLADAGALGALIAPEFSQLGGGLSLDGEIKGGDNKAHGYCLVTGNALRIRELPVDWMNACLLFEGETTRLSNLDAWSGNDHLAIQGTVTNRRPHAYQATAEVALENLTKRLSQIGVATVDLMGGGSVKGTWHGEGSTESHAGTFQASVSEWISSWTKAGMSGSCEGSYAKGRLELTKAQLRQDDLKLGFKLVASETKLEATEIVAVRGEKTKPLVEGSFTLPVNAATFWQRGSLGEALAMAEPLTMNVAFHGIKAEELTDLLGQPKKFAGTLAGTLVASGTTEKPVVHGALQINKFAESGTGDPKELALAFDVVNGRATAELMEQPVASAPLLIKAEGPFQLAKEKERIRLTDTAGSISMSATFRQAPMDGWMSLFGINSSPLRQVTLDGTITASGVIGKPAFEGGITLKAGEVELFGAQKLKQLVAPISMKGSAAQLTNGAAAYQGKPLSVSGTFDWGSAERALQIQLTGKDLPIQIEGLGALVESGNSNAGTSLRSVGIAELTLTTKGTNHPTLGGTISLSELAGSPLPTLVPSFAPPGIYLNPDPAEGSPMSNGIPNLQLELVVKTAASLPILPTAQTVSPTTTTNTNSADLPQLAMDLQLKGPAESPRVTGTLTANQWWVQLPSGRFIIPEVSVRLEEGKESGALTATAYGITQRGFCALTITGSLSQPAVGFTGMESASAPDLLLALAMPNGSYTSSMVPAEGIAWNRQAQLLPTPSAGWATSRLGKQDSGSLGFYGIPWIWSAGQGLGKTNTAPTQESN